MLAPEHPLVTKIATNVQKESVEAYIKQSMGKSEIERQSEDSKAKTGVFTGAYAVNPANNEAIPIWTADYVLMGYGTGAVMGVPAHDDRDYDFAKKYDLEIRQVLQTDKDSDFHSEGVVMNSGKYDGMRSEAMREHILKDFVEEGVATERVNYKIRDWLISRQRYCGSGKVVCRVIAKRISVTVNNITIGCIDRNPGEHSSCGIVTVGIV